MVFLYIIFRFFQRVVATTEGALLVVKIKQRRRNQLDRQMCLEIFFRKKIQPVQVIFFYILSLLLPRGKETIITISSIAF